MPTRIATVDASVLINFIHVDRLDILGQLCDWQFIVPEQVVAEVTNSDEAELLARAFQDGHLSEGSSTEPSEIEIYAALIGVMGKGEASCLAMAQARGWFVACDERRRFLREARERLGSSRIVNTAGILLLAIKQGAITVEEADCLKARLEEHRFRLSFDSFSDLLDDT